jgi:hypothetical protein
MRIRIGGDYNFNASDHVKATPKKRFEPPIRFIGGLTKLRPEVSKTGFKNGTALGFKNGGFKNGTALKNGTSSEKRDGSELMRPNLIQSCPVLIS